MDTSSPASERIGAALRALRQTHTHTSGDTLGLSVKCLHAVIGELAANGVAPEDLQPLADLEGFVSRRKTERDTARTDVADQVPSLAPAQAGGDAQRLLDIAREQRHGAPPSPTLLARTSVMIDLLVRSGQDEAEAAQSVMRRLLAVGVPAPAKGGDSRGWRRLLEFRNTLLQGGGSEEAKHEYRTFARELEGIPAPERVSRVLNERLWDRRRRR